MPLMAEQIAANSLAAVGAVGDTIHCRPVLY